MESNIKIHEHHHRTLFKSITWFIVGFLVTFGVLMFFTNDFTMSIVDAALIQVIKIMFFYIHERIWNKFSIGQVVRR
ncbi:hypothetical protein COB55_04540 [Candidatus Wolfebacteria bacterium]|nr:MAG: hypothetical protein COB55_04540 [Candidatus Wolfebacteria bacterium]